MTPQEPRQVRAVVKRLNEAAQEFRASSDSFRAALLALIEANEAQGRSIDKVIDANTVAIELFRADLRRAGLLTQTQVRSEPDHCDG